MKEFYLVPRKIAEHYGAIPQTTAKKQITESNSQSEREDREKDNNQFPMQIPEQQNTMMDKQLTTPLLPGSFSKKKGKNLRTLAQSVKDKSIVKGGGKKDRILKKKRKKTIFLQRRSSHGESQQLVGKPPLDAVINRYTQDKRKREYMRSLLYYFENNPSIIWDKNGNLTQPFSGYNIIDIIKDIAVPNSLRQADEFKLAMYKMLIHHADLPLQVVKSKKIAESVYGGGPTSKCSKDVLDKWLSYD